MLSFLRLFNVRCVADLGHGGKVREQVLHQRGSAHGVDLPNQRHHRRLGPARNTFKFLYAIFMTLM